MKNTELAERYNKLVEELNYIGNLFHACGGDLETLETKEWLEISDFLEKYSDYG